MQPNITKQVKPALQQTASPALQQQIEPKELKAPKRLRDFLFETRLLGVQFQALFQPISRKKGGKIGPG